MNVLSLFDGMSCGQIALERAGFKVDNYYASEIKPHAIDLVSKRYPKTIHIGDVSKVFYTNMGLELDVSGSLCRTIDVKINLLIGGSPCKGGSGLNQNREGMSHSESRLFYEYVRILKELRLCGCEDVYFLLENVRGNTVFVNEITKQLGVRPIRLNSSLVSAQNRPRLYWTNIPVTSIPANKRLTTEDVFLNEMPEDLICSEGRVKWLTSESGVKSIDKKFTYINPYPKAGCITANGHKKWNENYILRDGKYRYLSIRELEKLQTLPEGYCDGLSYDKAYDLIGDAWTVDIITHILNHIK